MKKLSAFVVCSISLAACTIPGMQEGRIAQQDAASIQDIEGRIDVYPIGPATLQALSDNHATILRQLPPVSEGAYQYRVGPQDLLRVTVWDHPELNNPGANLTSASTLSTVGTTTTAIQGTAPSDSSSRIVNDDGSMFYPYVGVIRVAGKTTEEIRTFIASALSKTIRQPQIEVAVAAYRSKRAYVTGDVKAPGVLPITDVPLTVADAIAAAGGANADADIADVTLTRDHISYQLDIYAFLYQGDISQNIRLESGDILNVPEQRFNKVFVLGEVIKPASLPMPRGIYTLTEALSDSGGVSQITAEASQIYVIRGSPASRISVFHLDARRADALVIGDQFKLLPRDIIFVDAAAIVRASRVVGQILPALQALQAGKYLGQ